MAPQEDLDAKLEQIMNELRKMQAEGDAATGGTRQALALCLTDIYYKTKPQNYLRYNTIKSYKLGDPVPPALEYIKRFCSSKNRRYLIADAEILQLFHNEGLEPPSFLEAGSYRELAFEPEQVRVGIVASGGVAPGLNTVVHNIVSRHEGYVTPDSRVKPTILGVRGGFKGLHEGKYKELTSKDTADWVHLGGCELGVGRDREMKNNPGYIEEIVTRLYLDKIDMLYVIGGDGSMTGAHKVAEQIKEKGYKISVVGIPKTMDNDVLWCEETFGFDTTINEAARMIRALHEDVKATGRLGIIQLFGAEAGFVAEFAALASGECDAFLIPEMFQDDELPRKAIERKVNQVVEQIIMQGEEPPHGIIVVAEGVKPDRSQDRDQSLAEIVNMAQKALKQYPRIKLTVITNQPRHLIRAIPPTSTDQILCRRLASLAVDCALAGYHDIMISQLLREYVMVPLALVVDLPVKKRLPVHEMLFGMAMASQAGI